MSYGLAKLLFIGIYVGFMLLLCIAAHKRRKNDKSSIL